MAKTCPHCDMESDRDEYCTWCGKLFEAKADPPKPGAPPAGRAPAPAAPPGPGAPPAGPAPRTDAPAKRAPTKIERPRPAWVYYVAVGIGLVVLYVVGCFAVAWAATSPPDEPTDWKRVEGKTKELTVEVPSNWECLLSGSEGSFEFVTVKAGKLYTVTLKGTQGKGTIGDIGAAAGRAASGLVEGGLEMPVAETAAGGLHQWNAMTEEDPAFADTSDMQETTFGGRTAVCSEYTTVRGFGMIAGVKMKGWRLSVPAGDLGYDIRIQCPEAHWDEFYPVAKRIVETGAFGTGS